jgi:hypothetical protein
MDTQYPGGKRSSRVKDLVDLVLIAHTQTADLEELRAAIAAKRDLSNIGPFEHFDIPAEWARTYPATAKGVPAGRALHRADRSRLRGILHRPSARKPPETGHLGPAGAYLDPGQEQPDDSPGRHLSRK